MYLRPGPEVVGVGFRFRILCFGFRDSVLRVYRLGTVYLLGVSREYGNVLHGDYISVFPTKSQHVYGL